jgi:uncharacterized OB-fold protein
MIQSIGTYLPPWGRGDVRTTAGDEDAVTLAVAAGREAIAGRGDAIGTVVLVTRDLPLLEGGNAAALLAGLGLAPTTSVREQVGGAPAALEAVAVASPGTLVIGADLEPAGAAAVLCGDGGLGLDLRGRVNRSLPVATRDAEGRTTDYADPRLLRERGLGVSLEQAGVSGKAAAVAGVGRRDAVALCEGDPPVLPTVGASAGLFAVAAIAERRDGGLIVGVDQANVVAVELAGGAIDVVRREPAAVALPRTTPSPGPGIGISLAAYERAFDQKLRLEAARCTTCGTLALPARYRCLGCGSEAATELVPLPRGAVVYTTTTVHVPVPGLATPYSLVLVELGDTGVRTLVQVTGAEAGTVAIDDHGELVFRRVALRSGVPDYGYSFLPAARPASEVAA